MSAFLKSAGDWWHALSPRERLMLGGLGPVCALLILWYGVASPLLGWRATGLTELEAARRDAAFVEQAALEAATLGTSSKPATPADLRSGISESATRHGIAISRLQPEPAGGINVWVEGVAPALLYGWLAELDATYGIGAARATVGTTDTGGTVSVQLLLTGSAS